MSMEIEQATKHGVNVFIFDWYWYDGRPFMETTLNNGFLKADNVDKMQFYLDAVKHVFVDEHPRPGSVGHDKCLE